MTSSEFPAPFIMAFQSIVNARTRTVFAYEAVVRGPRGEPAQAILDLLTPANRGFLCAIPAAQRLPPPSARCLDDAGTAA
ncbi:hypothetical protein [Acidithiobacillus sp.]